MKITVSEFDEKTKTFKHYEREEDFSETADRHDNLCIVCGFSAYPECIKVCHNECVRESYEEYLKKLG